MLHEHLERDNATKKLLMVFLSYAQLAVGSGTKLLPLPYKGYAHMVQDIFVKKLWQCLHICKAQVHIPGLWIPGLQCNHDCYLMEVSKAAGFEDWDRLTLPKVIMELKVHTVSDIKTLNSTQIKPG